MGNFPKAISLSPQNFRGSTFFPIYYLALYFSIKSQNSVHFSLVLIQFLNLCFLEIRLKTMKVLALFSLFFILSVFMMETAEGHRRRYQKVRYYKPWKSSYYGQRRYYKPTRKPTYPNYPYGHGNYHYPQVNHGSPTQTIERQIPHYHDGKLHYHSSIEYVNH